MPTTTTPARRQPTLRSPSPKPAPRARNGAVHPLAIPVRLPAVYLAEAMRAVPQHHVARLPRVTPPPKQQAPAPKPAAKAAPRRPKAALVPRCAQQAATSGNAKQRSASQEPVKAQKPRNRRELAAALVTKVLGQVAERDEAAVRAAVELVEAVMAGVDLDAAGGSVSEHIDDSAEASTAGRDDNEASNVVPADTAAAADDDAPLDPVVLQSVVDDFLDEVYAAMPLPADDEAAATDVEDAEDTTAAASDEREDPSVGNDDTAPAVTDDEPQETQSARDARYAAAMPEAKDFIDGVFTDAIATVEDRYAEQCVATAAFAQRFASSVFDIALENVTRLWNDQERVRRGETMLEVLDESSTRASSAEADPDRARIVKLLHTHAAGVVHDYRTNLSAVRQRYPLRASAATALPTASTSQLARKAPQAGRIRPERITPSPAPRTTLPPVAAPRRTAKGGAMSHAPRRTFLDDVVAPRSCQAPTPTPGPAPASHLEGVPTSVVTATAARTSQWHRAPPRDRVRRADVGCRPVFLPPLQSRVKGGDIGSALRPGII